MKVIKELCLFLVYERIGLHIGMKGKLSKPMRLVKIIG
jgi:hypothetical protein